jgi:hypothetical protein
MSQFRNSLLVAAVGLVACGRANDAAPPPADDARAAPAARGGVVALPVATIEFREGTERISSHEKMLVTEQQACLQTLSAGGKPARTAATSAEALAGPRRLVRAYYGGDRMAWYEVNRIQDVDDESCAIRDRRERRVVIARNGEVFVHEVNEDGAVNVDQYPIEASGIATPRELGDGKVLRKVAAQDCVTDPTEISSADAGVVACYWREQPPIRDAGFAEIPLYTRAPGVLPDDPPVVWEAVEIVAGTPPPREAFEVPASDRALDTRFFPQEKP